MIGNSQEDYNVSSMGSESSNPPHLVSVCSYCITVVSDIHDTVARLHPSSCVLNGLIRYSNVSTF